MHIQRRTLHMSILVILFLGAGSVLHQIFGASSESGTSAALRARVTNSDLPIAPLAGGTDGLPSADELNAQFVERVRPLLDTHCLRCHNEKKHKGGVRLDDLAGVLDEANVPRWTEVKNVLDVGAMPPEEVEERPSRIDQDLLLKWIGNALRRYEMDHLETGGDTLLRRINLRAYANMLRTLLDVPPQGLEQFPPDGEVQGFDTVGSALYTDATLYDQYLKTAQRTLDLALPTTPQPPKVIERKLYPKDGALNSLRRQGQAVEKMIADLQKDHRALPKVRADFGPKAGGAKGSASVIDAVIAEHFGVKSFKELAKQNIKWEDDPECARKVGLSLQAERERLKAQEARVEDFQPIGIAGNATTIHATIDQPGYYLVRVRAQLSNPDCPMPLRIVVNQENVSMFLVYDPPGKPGVHEVRVFLGQGKSRITLVSLLPGRPLHHVKYLLEYVRAIHGFHPRYERQSEREERTEAEKGPYPEALSDELSLHGPIHAVWPPPAVARIFPRGLKADPGREYAEEILSRFMRQAYGGACDPAVVRPYVDLVMSHYDAKQDFPEAVKYALAAVLSSPRFLYLFEEQRAEPARRRALNGTELARRLAYALWSDLPDEALWAGAAGGELTQDAELRAQIKRLLADPRARAFCEGFATRWLKIDQLGSLSISNEHFAAFDELLRKSAIDESVEFFSELLRRNESALNFLDSDFAMLNGRLAQHYGIPGVTGNEFRRVKLPPGSRRGGVLTQASVLMATSNGMVTSLVRRGAFVMERLLGVHPGTPPPNVPSLDRVPMDGKDGEPLAPRDRLSMHREVPSCARCHDRIDPLGVGLEKFNALGAYGEKLALLLPGLDAKGLPRWAELEADVRGAMLDGSAYDGSDELKKRLLEQKDRFLRCLAEHLAVYMLGRSLQLSDAPVLDGICANAAKEGYGLYTLVEGLLLSELFRTK
ncbi:MAG: DUF1592 domain-containing protein [Planctomycetota bacterium]|nr:DUF1592 domain-containing protein [Planctomycetota bacterium]